MIAVAFLLALQQAPLGPELPPGCDVSFSYACQLVEESLEKGDFKEAGERTLWLPNRSIKIGWDDSRVPVLQRPSLVLARDKAIRLWKKAVPTLKIQVAKSGDISVRFQHAIERKLGDAFNPGASHRISITSKRKNKVDIALTRGATPVKVSPKDVQNEVGYAIGLYLGLAPSPLYSFIMGRTEQPNRIFAQITDEEAEWARTSLDVSDLLRNAVTKRKRLRQARPMATVNDISPKQTDVLQGDKPVYHITIRNSGNAPLSYRLSVTCACLLLDPKGKILPSQGAEVEVTLDTTEFVGDLKKTVYVYTNDADKPLIELPIVSHITPRFRLLCPTGNTYLLDRQLEFDVYLAIPDKADLRPLRAILDGPKGEVTMTPWQGELADPELKEGPKQRKGYKLHVDIPEQTIYGRKMCLVNITTDQVDFRTLSFGFSIQKGIVVTPSQIYLGEVKDGTEGVGILSQPGKPFKITKVESPQTYLTAKIEPGKNAEECRILVRYRGKAPKGSFRVLLKATTDDPNQPEILVPVGGVVK